MNAPPQVLVDQSVESLLELFEEQAERLRRRIEVDLASLARRGDRGDGVDYLLRRAYNDGFRDGYVIGTAAKEEQSP